MKRFVSILLALMLAALPLTGFAEGENYRDSVPKLAGFRSDSAEGNSDWVTFTPDAVSEVTSVMTLENYIVSAECVDGMVYGYDFNRGYFTCALDANNNPTAPVFNGYVSDYNIVSMAYDVTTDTMYAVGNHYLLTIDLETGVPTRIARVSGAANVVTMIACDANGQLYTIAMNNAILYTLDKTTAVATACMDLPVVASAYIQDMTFDLVNGIIYWAHWGELNTYSDSMLYAVDPANERITEVGRIGSIGTCLGSLFITGYEGGGSEFSELDLAMSGDAETFHFETEGDYPWFATEIDGRTVGSAGNTGTEEWSESVVRSTITLEEGEMLAFDFRCSTELDWDYFCFAVDGYQYEAWSGEEEWQTYYYLPQEAGTFEFMWLYEKDDSNSEGEDCAWVDNVRIVPEGENHTVTFINGITGEVLSTCRVLHGYDVAGWFIPNAPVSAEYPFIGWNGSTENVTEDRVITSMHEGLTPPQVPGDVDGDGNIAIADALIAARNALNLESLTDAQIAAADVDGDGNVTIADALMIARMALGLQ